MLDWLTIFAVNQIVGAFSKPFLTWLQKELTSLVGEAARDWMKDLLKGIPNKLLSKITTSLQQEDTDKAVGKALKEFIQLIQLELDDLDIEETEQKAYIEPFKKFINNKQVKEVLGSAFDYDKQKLDTKTLETIWYNLNLTQLPDDFDWEKLGKRYLKKVKSIIRDSDTLRAILDSENIESIKDTIKDNTAIPTDFDLLRYQETIRERYEKLSLDSIDASGYAYEPLKLWQIFIEQDARQVHSAAPKIYELPKEHYKRLLESGQIDTEIEHEEIEQYRKSYLEQPILPIFDIINNKTTYKYIVILGDPGSGKSTLLQKIALNWATSPLNNNFSQPIPLLIELRTYARKREERECNNFLEYFHKCSGIIHNLNQHKVDEQLRAGNAIVLFDGLDEVFDPARREEVITDIHNFTNKYPNAQVIVTSRVIGYKYERLRNAEFHHFILQDLNEHQIQDFIVRWHDLTYNNEQEKIRKRERLKKAVENLSAIQELAGNPLLLTMMAILNRNQELPPDRAELYNQASRVLLHQWDIERALIEDARLDPKTIDYKDKQAMLREVAYFMQTSEKGLAGNLISTHDLEKIITEYFKNIDFDKPRERARATINQLRTRNFMLCFLGADYYGFVHRTFLEYFTAWWFVWQFKEAQTWTIEKLKIDLFGAYWHDETWHEVLRLVCGMIDAKFVGEIIEYLIARNGEDEQCKNIFLAAECLTEVRNRNTILSVSNELLSQLKALIKYDLIRNHTKSSEEESIVSSIRSQAVKLIATTWSEDTQTKNWLIICVQNDNAEYVRSTAVRELAEEWEEDADTLPLIRNIAQTDNHFIVRRTAVEELAERWREDHNTLSIIRNIAQTDNHFIVRRTAVIKLAEGWNEDLLTLPLIQNIAQNDNHEEVRSAAVIELGKRWNQNNDNLLLIQNIVKNDNDFIVLMAAVEALAEGWKGNSNTFICLQDIVKNHSHEFIQSIALNKLAEEWKENSDTLPFIQNIAQNTFHIYLRKIAVELLAKSWREDPSTILVLRSIVENDNDYEVQDFAHNLLQKLENDNL